MSPKLLQPMTITYKEIKPLLADATFSNNRLLCKFQDPHTSQVILSAADVPHSLIQQANASTTYAGLFKRALAKINLSKEIAKSPAEQEAVINAFQKVSHLFEKENGVVRMKR
jgi:hypothetical protein